MDTMINPFPICNAPPPPASAAAACVKFSPSGKFRLPTILLTLVHLILLPSLSCADEEKTLEFAVAALELPSGSDGLLHWTVGEEATSPVQISKRYFTEPVKVNGAVVRFYAKPLPALTTEEPPPQPLITVNLPADSKRSYIVLSLVPDEKGQERWRSNVLRGEDWKEGCLRVFNVGKEPIGIAAGAKRIGLAKGKTADFQAGDWGDAFPVKIFKLEPENKLLFSSTWRVAPSGRELCLIGETNGNIRLRSLLALPPMPRKGEP